MNIFSLLLTHYKPWDRTWLQPPFLYGLQLYRFDAHPSNPSLVEIKRYYQNKLDQNGKMRIFIGDKEVQFKPLSHIAYIDKQEEL